MEDDDLVVLERFPYVHHADVAASILRGSGLRCIVREGHGGARPELNPAGEGVALFVRAADVSAARDVLAEDRFGTQEDPRKGFGDEPIVCAGCDRELPSPSADCPVCNDPEFTTVLEPEKTGAAIGRLKIAVVLLTIGIPLAAVVLRRLPELGDAVPRAILYVVGGFAIVWLLLKVLSSSESL